MQLTKSRALLLGLLTLLTQLVAGAQNVNSAYLNYIKQYAEMARDQQRKHGIPASITLAQGLLESGAGRSTLASQGNNHFGIKCHSTWTGPSMLRNDDAPNECFRVYGSAEESFNDHSQFLHGRRYTSLFDLEPSDYAGWAHGLSRCGYATDPNYAYKLISIIELYELYTYDEGYKEEDVAEFILAQLKDSHPVRRSRGLHYVIALPGDTYAFIAGEFNMDPEKLAEYNDAENGTAQEIRAWEEVYLQPKLDKAPDKISKVTIGEDETAHSVAQRYGVSMKLIRDLNPNFKDKPGTTLRLKK